jgi:hypothetical protein
MSHVTDEEHDTRTASPRVGSASGQAVFIVAVFAAVGVLAGVLWEWLWTPPMAVAAQQAVQPTLESARGQFSGTAWYVVIASLAGLFTAAVLALAFDRREIVTLAAVLGGSALGAWLMLVVGTALGPADPQTVAATAADGTRIPMDLDVSGRSPYLAMPAGALIGLVVIFFGVGRLHRNGS